MRPPPFIVDGGTALARVDPLPPCSQKRIRALYAVPGDLTIGEGTRVEAQFMPAAPAAAFSVSWWLWENGGQTARGTLRPLSTCQPGSAACARFTCLESRAVSGDPDASAPAVWVVARYEDDSCYELNQLMLPCVPPAAPAQADDAGASPQPRDAAPTDGAAVDSSSTDAL